MTAIALVRIGGQWLLCPVLLMKAIALVRIGGQWLLCPVLLMKAIDLHDVVRAIQTSLLGSYCSP